MKLNFDACDVGRDFEACCDLPGIWAESSNDPCSLYQRAFIWFKAYDLLVGPYTKDDARLRAEGYEFSCLVRIRSDWANIGAIDEDLGVFGARDMEEAERLLQVAADALYGEERR